MISSAQASLEYLLVFAAFATALYLLLPAFTTALDAVLFSLDCMKASSFTGQLSASTKTMHLFAAGTTISIPINPVSEWTIRPDANRLVLVVDYKKYSKKFFLPPAITIHNQFLVSASSRVILEKKEDALLLRPEQ